MKSKIQVFLEYAKAQLSYSENINCSKGIDHWTKEIEHINELLNGGNNG